MGGEPLGYMKDYGPRHYSGHARQDATKIAGECMVYGVSTQWSGALEERMEIEALLRPRGIIYSDDMRGEWKRVDPPEERPGTILERVLGVMQEADELGGPPLEAYVALMESIATEAARRAEVARENNRPIAKLLGAVRDAIAAYDRSGDHTSRVQRHGCDSAGQRRCCDCARCRLEEALPPDTIVRGA